MLQFLDSLINVRNQLLPRIRVKEKMRAFLRYQNFGYFWLRGHYPNEKGEGPLPPKIRYSSHCVRSYNSRHVSLARYNFPVQFEEDEKNADKLFAVEFNRSI